MSKPTFNLVFEPWIPCEAHDGTRVDLGLLDVLRQAHQLAGLQDESPLVTGALHRLLLAIIHRCFGPATLDDWEQLHKRGKFEVEKVAAYLSQWEQRFDLFDESHPFFQSPNLHFEWQAPSSLIAQRSNYGAAVNLFESRPHSHDLSISSAEAGRHLLAIQAFHTGGTITGDRKAGDPTSAVAAPLSSLALVLLRGGTLFETLLLNTLEYDPDSALPIPSPGDDSPAWERDPCAMPERRPPDGWLDWLTWQSRRVWLRPSADGRCVTGAIVAGGYDQSVDPSFEPMAAYRIDEKAGVRPVAVSRDRALWRDSNAFLHLKEAQHQPPKQVVQARHLIQRGVLPETTRQLMVFGQDKYQAKIFVTRAEYLPLSNALIASDVLIEHIEDAVLLAEEGQQALSRSVHLAAKLALASISTRDPDSADVRSLANSTQFRARYWAALAHPFRALLGDVTADADAAARAFQEQIRRQLKESYDQAARQLRAGGAGLRAAVRGQEKLYFERARLFPNENGGSR